MSGYVSTASQKLVSFGNGGGDGINVLLALLTDLFTRPASKTIWVELVDMKDMNSTFDAEMMKLAGDLQGQEVILSGKEKNWRDCWEHFALSSLDVYNWWKKQVLPQSDIVTSDHLLELHGTGLYTEVNQYHPTSLHTRNFHIKTVHVVKSKKQVYD